MQVNGSSVGNLDLSSHSAWQYLKGDHEYDQVVDGSSARFRFDETRLLLKDIQLKSGDKISLVKKKDDNVPYGIDFIELEQAPAPVAQGENSISIVDKGASANDDSDDTVALLAAVEEAKASGKSVYIPEGRFNFDKQVNIEADNLKISGAGVWHTQLHFTSDKRYGGGIVFGPTPRSYKYSLPRKVRQLAIKSALSQKVLDNALVVVDALNFDAPKTKEFAGVMDNLKVAEKVLVVVTDDDKNAALSARNLANATVVTPAGVNILSVVDSQKIVITKSALSQVEEVLA